MTRLRVTNLDRQTTLVTAGRVADTALARNIGLLRDRHLTPGDGLWIVPCNGIHSVGMQFVFDAIFLDKHHRVIHLYPQMKPWRISRICLWSGHTVLEVPVGTIAQSQTQLGDRLRLDKFEDKV